MYNPYKASHSLTYYKDTMNIWHIVLYTVYRALSWPFCFSSGAFFFVRDITYVRVHIGMVFGPDNERRRRPTSNLSQFWARPARYTGTTGLSYEHSERWWRDAMMQVIKKHAYPGIKENHILQIYLVLLPKFINCLDVSDEMDGKWQKFSMLFEIENKFFCQ